MAFPILSSKLMSVLKGQTPTVFMVRHGDTALNSGHTSPEKFRGHSDVPLSKEGRAEGQDLANKLAQYSIEKVYSSDLSRASDTAEMIAKVSGIEHEEDVRLRPWDLGELTETPVKEGIPILKKYTETPNRPLPGGESLNTFKTKFLTALDEILEEAVDEAAMLTVVTHTRGLQLAKASGAAPGGFANHTLDIKVFEDYSNEVSTGALLKLEYSKGAWSITGQDPEDK